MSGGGGAACSARGCRGGGDGGCGGPPCTAAKAGCGPRVSTGGRKKATKPRALWPSLMLPHGCSQTNVSMSSASGAAIAEWHFFSAMLCCAVRCSQVACGPWKCLAQIDTPVPKAQGPDMLKSPLSTVLRCGQAHNRLTASLTLNLLIFSVA